MWRRACRERALHLLQRRTKLVRMPSAADRESTAPSASPRRGGLALWIFLGLVAAAVLAGLRQKYPTPDFAGSVALLADGDLDHDERERMLRRTFDFAVAMQGDHPQWIALLAAVGLDDPERLEKALAGLGGLPPRAAPVAAEREFLHLGDPMLGNVASALLAEVAQDRELARTRWSQVDVQGRMVGNACARQLAAAAAVRLR